MSTPETPRHDAQRLTPASHEAHQAEILSAADTMSSEELDTLPYGMIQLDATGRILKYNAVESRLAQLPQETTVGRKFFSEVAPCTKVQQFYGQFKEGVLREIGRAHV